MLARQILQVWGANISIPDNRGHTPLNAACLEANLTTVQFLLQAGVNPHVPGRCRLVSRCSIS